MQTEYQGPVRVDVIQVGTESLRLVRPAEPDRMLDDSRVAELNRVGDYMPYWAYLWPGTFLLAEVISRHTWQGEQALELGCGLGVAGLIGLARGLRVRFTDYDAAPFEFVRRSAAENGFDPSRLETVKLDWNEPPDERFRLIIAADVLYERRLVPLVAKTLAAMLADDGEAWIADPYRVAAEDFPAQLAKYSLTYKTEPLEVNSDELGRIRGTLHRVRREPV